MHITHKSGRLAHQPQRLKTNHKLLECVVGRTCRAHVGNSFDRGKISINDNNDLLVISIRETSQSLNHKPIPIISFLTSIVSF